MLIIEFYSAKARIDLVASAPQEGFQESQIAVFHKWPRLAKDMSPPTEIVIDSKFFRDVFSQ